MYVTTKIGGSQPLLWRPGFSGSDVRHLYRSLLSEASKLADLGASSTTVSALLRPPRSLASELLMTGVSADHRDFHTLVDGGANKGQFCKAFLRRFPGGAVFAFEPDDRATPHFRKTF